MAANVVAYPDIALEIFTGLDPSEYAQEFFSLIKSKIHFSLGARDPADAGLQAAYDDRQNALFGSVLRGPAAQWFETLAPALAVLRISSLLNSLMQRISTEKGLK